MSLNFYSPRNFFEVICSLVIISLTVLHSNVANAQRRHTSGVNYDGNSWYSGNGGGGGTSDWGLTIGLGYDIPGKTITEVYKAAPVFEIGVLRNYNDFTFGLNVGYHSNKPKQKVITYAYEGEVLGEFKYDPFKIVSLYASGAYNLPMGNAAKFYGGLNFGINYISQGFEYNDETTEVFTKIENEQHFYLAPKLGLKFFTGSALGLGVEARYNYILQPGEVSSREGTTGFNSYSSYSGHLMLTYNF